METLLTRTDERGVATLRLHRPELHNAFDDALIEAMNRELARLEADPAVRLLILEASGKSFSAGADLGWMRRMAAYSREENLADALKLSELMDRLSRFSRPTLALVQGAAFGGGVGLVACCDIALGTPGAAFCLSEVKLGLIPAVISPYVVGAIGPRAARRYFQSAERFDAAEALRLGLLHELVEPGELETRAEAICAQLLANGPQAMARAKALVELVAHRPVDAELRHQTACRIADARASEEGREGLAAFFEKRSPKWVKG